MNSSCRRMRGTSGVGDAPRSVTPDSAAWMFAGSTAMRKTISAIAAARRVCGRSSPIAPRTSQIPIKVTINSRLGTAGGTHAHHVRPHAVEVRGGREAEHDRESDPSGGTPILPRSHPELTREPASSVTTTSTISGTTQ